jgi:hypothetical protein
MPKIEKLKLPLSPTSLLVTLKALSCVTVVDEITLEFVPHPIEEWTEVSPTTILESVAAEGLASTLKLLNCPLAWPAMEAIFIWSSGLAHLTLRWEDISNGDLYRLNDIFELIIEECADSLESLIIGGSLNRKYSIIHYNDALPFVAFRRLSRVHLIGWVPHIDWRYHYLGMFFCNISIHEFV